MSKNVSIGLIAIGVVLIVVAGLEHLMLRVEIVPHLAIYLAVIGVLAAGVGVYGLVTGKPKPSSDQPTWP